jgi:hypothetical protein
VADKRPPLPIAFGTEVAVTYGRQQHAELSAQVEAAELDYESSNSHYLGFLVLMTRSALQEAEEENEALRREMRRAGVRADRAEGTLTTERAESAARLAKVIAERTEASARAEAAEQALARAASAPAPGSRTEVEELTALLIEADMEINRLKKDMHAAQLRIAALTAPAEPDAPLPIRELLAADTVPGILALAAQHCPLLRITADPDEAVKLDHAPYAAAYRTKTVETLASMQIYAAAKAQARQDGQGAGPQLQNLRAFAESGRFDTGLPYHHVVLMEANSENIPRLAEQRRFPIPPEVGPEGVAYMHAHVRIGSGKPPAPRLHYLDDTDASGLLVVGYLGAHLDVQSTN